MAGELIKFAGDVMGMVSTWKRTTSASCCSAPTRTSRKAIASSAGPHRVRSRRPAMIGRVVNAIGQPADARARSVRPVRNVEFKAPGVIQRQP